MHALCPDLLDDPDPHEEAGRVLYAQIRAEAFVLMAAHFAMRTADAVPLRSA